MNYVHLVYYKVDTTHNVVQAVFSSEDKAKMWLEETLTKYEEHKEMMREYYYIELRQVDYYC